MRRNIDRSVASGMRVTLQVASSISTLGGIGTLMLALAAASAQAQVWLGNDATDPTDFNLVANWSTGAVPGSGQTATFGAGPASTFVNVTALTGLGAGGLLFDAAAPAYTIDLNHSVYLTNITNNSGAVQTINVGASSGPHIYLHFVDPGVAGPVSINQTGYGVVQFDTSYDASAASITASGTTGALLILGAGSTVSIGSLNASTGRISFGAAGTMIEVGALNQNDTFTGNFTVQDDGTGGIRKVGTGTQWLNLFTQAGVGYYSGPTEVRSGTLNMGSAVSFGVGSGGTTVWDGATLGLGGSNYIVDELISLAGQGVGNAGALRNLSGNHTLGGVITLTGNTRINSDAGRLTLTGTLVQGSHDLDFGGAGDTTVTGIINGNGWVNKDGTGTLVLSGENTYTGLTIVKSGALQAGAANALSPNSYLSVWQSGLLDLNNFDQTVKGLGSHALLGGGALSLGGATLTLSDNSNGAIAYSGDIHGAGSLIKEGSSEQSFDGTSTYSGSTLINGGTLSATGVNALSANSAHVVAAGATLGLWEDQIIGSLAGAGVVSLTSKTLTAGSDDTSTTFSGSMTGTGSFIKTGAGAFTLEGTQTYSGATTIAGGTLAVNGTLAGSAATVNSGATLKGTGTVGNVTVQAGGIHAPGNSIGTQFVNGPYILQAGSILEIELNAAGQSDRVVVTGTVDLTGATLRVLADGGNYAIATDYLIIDNDGADAVSGTFGAVTSNLAFLTPTVVYDGGDGNDVMVTMTRNDVEFGDIAQTPNQSTVAGALNGLPINSPLVAAVFGQSAEGARQAFDALSGEVHATLASTLARDARFTRGAIFSRLQQAFYGGASANGGGSGNSGEFAALGNTGTTSVAGRFDAPMMGLGMGSTKDAGASPSASPLVFWTQAFGSWGDADGDGNAATAKRTIGGFLSGVDTGIGNGWRAGAVLGYSRSNVSVSQRISSAEIDSYHLAAYAGGPVSAFALRTGASWSWNDIDTERTVVFPGFLDRVEADYGGDTGQIFGEIALPMGAGTLAYEPFAGLAYVHVSTDRFTEQGGIAALDGFGGDQNVGFSTLGIRFAAETTIGGTRVTPRASFAWQHAFGDVDPMRTLAFSGAPGMTIAGTPLARNSALIEAGLDVSLSPSATLGISYNGEIASDVEDHGVSGRLNWRF